VTEVSQQRKGKPRGASGFFSKLIQPLNLNPTVQIKRWFDQRLRSHQPISYFLKIISLIAKLPKIKTNSSDLRKISRKLLRTHNDIYFLIMSSKVKFSQFQNSGSHNPTSLKEFRPRNSLYRYYGVEFFNSCITISLH
jgi:hypothetical protein